MNHFPLVLPHPQVRRILDKRAACLIITRKIKVGTYDVQDALVVRRNERFRKKGHFEQMTNPSVFAITITEITKTPLGNLNLPTVMAMGFKTQRDFYDDWLERHRYLDLSEPVSVCRFGFADQGRYLHGSVHRGYTTIPAEGAKGEPQALSAAELKELAGAATRRYEREHREEIRAQRARSVMKAIRKAEQNGDVSELRSLRAQLDRLIKEHERAA